VAGERCFLAELESWKDEREGRKEGMERVYICASKR